MPYSPDRGPRPSAPRSRPVAFPVSIGAHLRRLLDWRYRSVLRGTALVFVSTLVSFRMSHFPENNRNFWLVVPLGIATVGTLDTTRCMQKRWSWYHGGVVLCIYTDLMVLCMIAFFLLYPLWL